MPASAEASPRVFQICLGGLMDVEADVRLTAVLAFGDLKDRSPLSVLLEVAQRDPSPEVQEIALNVYQSLSDHGRF